MKLLQTLSLLALFLMLANNKVQSQDDHTEFQIDSFDPDPAAQNLIYQRGARVPSDASFLRLTRTDSSGNPRRDSIGRVLYSPPVKFWEPGRQATFETTITFFITPPSNNNPADGIVFFIAPVGFHVGASGGSFGVFSSSGTASQVFAVEFDVYVNSEWDPSYRHIGIDINSIYSQNTTRFEGGLGEAVTARINYNSNTRTITVVATVEGSSDTYEVSYVHDLKTVLPQEVQVGISAATGQEVAVFNCLRWYFNSQLVWDGVSEKEAKFLKQVV